MKHADTSVRGTVRTAICRFSGTKLRSGLRKAVRDAGIPLIVSPLLLADGIHGPNGIMLIVIYFCVALVAISTIFGEAFAHPIMHMPSRGSAGSRLRT